MKKFMALFLCLTLFASLVCNFSISVAAEETASYSNYDIIKEVVDAYDRQLRQVHYDQSYARRNIYSSPEEATAQRTMFLDCSSFVNACYREAFGVNVLPVDIAESKVSPNTANFVTYTKENSDNEDVVGYWELQTYKTDTQKQELTKWIYDNLEIGDILVYRHGPEKATKGHVYIYVGDMNLAHCQAGSSYKRDTTNPSLSYDMDSSETRVDWVITSISVSTVFEDEAHNRYIFKKTEKDTNWEMGIIRPFARGLTPTEKALKRMQISGLSMEKVCSVYENSSVKPNDVLTYIVTLENTNETAMTGITITDMIPDGTEYVSGDDGVTVADGSLLWKGDVPALSKINVGYRVRVTETNPGTLITSDKTYVSGVKLGKITHSVSGYSGDEHNKLTEIALSRVNSAKKYGNGIELVKDVYKSALGIDLFDYTTTKEALNDLIDTENLTSHKTTDVSKMIVPNLYGGYDIRNGWLYHETENDRTRLPKEEHLSIGDIILADWDGGDTVYMYVGNRTLVTAEDGVCKTLTIGDDIFIPGNNILISLLGYNRYAVLRPSMLSGTPSGDENTNAPKFADLENHAWARDAINTLASNGIIKGVSKTAFAPEENITRADFAMLLVRAFKLECENTENFADVMADDYFAAELAIARNSGLVGGIGNNMYAPQEFITREDMIVIIHRALAKLEIELASADATTSTNSYADFADTADYAKKALLALVGAGLVNGKGEYIAPTDNTTRAEVAVLLDRILDYIKR